MSILGHLSVEGKIIVIEQTNSVTEGMKNLEAIINNIKIITENVTNYISEESTHDNSKTWKYKINKQDGNNTWTTTSSIHWD